MYFFDLKEEKNVKKAHREASCGKLDCKGKLTLHVSSELSKKLYDMYEKEYTPKKECRTNTVYFEHESESEVRLYWSVGTSVVWMTGCVPNNLSVPHMVAYMINGIARQNAVVQKEETDRNLAHGATVCSAEKAGEKSFPPEAAKSSGNALKEKEKKTSISKAQRMAVSKSKLAGARTLRIEQTLVLLV